jgi:ribosomal protein L9
VRKLTWKRAQVEDPLRIAEQSLLDSLSTIPQPLEFSRLTTSSTSSDLFGSVSVSDVITALKERDIKIEEGMGSFGESDGIEKGRVKKTGTFDCESPPSTLAVVISS